jgi:hypothetical protein
LDEAGRRTDERRGTVPTKRRNRSASRARGRIAGAAAILAALLLVTSFGAGLLNALGADPEGGRGRRTGEPTPGLVSARLKQVGSGLYLTSGPSSRMPFIDHAVIGATWASLEPRDQVFNGAVWRRMRQVLRRHPDLKVRLRIMAGRFAPSFVKQLGGPPMSSEEKDCSREGGIAIVQPANQIAACVPYFWTDAVLREYRELMLQVARRFDRHPRVLDVVNSACMTNWAEPFIRSGSHRASNARLWAAGLNEATDRRCLERSMRIHDAVFDRTRTSLATHQQWQIVADPAVDADGVRPSWSKERELLERFTARYGPELVIQNNGLGGDDGCADGTPAGSTLFCWMAGLSVKGFQLEGDRKLESEGFTVHDAVQRALELGACFVEHNQFGTDRARARRYDDLLERNCR